jgi:hypothetical protein
VPFTGFRQVNKRASRNLQLFDLRQQNPAGRCCEPGSHPAGIDEVPTLVISDKDGIHEVSAWNVASDDELLSAISPPLQPVAGALTGTIGAACALRNDPFETILLDRRYEFGQRCIKSFRISNCRRKLPRNFVQPFAPLLEWPRTNILNRSKV